MIGDVLRRQNGPLMVTGHTGFKGSWLCVLLDSLGVQHFGYSLPPEPNSLFERIGLEDLSPGKYGDIRDVESLKSYMEKIQPSILIHMAAQPLVLKSYEKPFETFEINAQGTANVLSAAFEVSSVKAVLVVTTDKVYKNTNSGKRFVENDPLEGHDPYSASKVAAESACLAWQQIREVTGGPKVIIARAGNVIGGGDYSENRLIPDIIKSVISGNLIEVRNPNSSRPWQHVLDPLMGYLSFIEQSLAHENLPLVLNFGPKQRSLTVDEIVKIAETHYSSRLSVRRIENPNSLEAKSLDLNSDKATNYLGWNPVFSQVDAAELTFQWWDSALISNFLGFKALKKDINECLSRYTEIGSTYQPNSLTK